MLAGTFAMAASNSALRDAFLEDHRNLMRGLSRLLEAIEENDLPTAVQTARELDRVAGPHIEFEEEIFYPRLAKTLGRQFARQLVEEHRTGLNAVKTVLDCEQKGAIEPEQRAAICEEIRTMLDHAAVCGTLLSHITVLDEKQQQDLLDQLQEIRRQGHRWSELPPRDKSDAPSGCEDPRDKR